MQNERQKAAKVETFYENKQKAGASRYCTYVLLANTTAAYPATMRKKLLKMRGKTKITPGLCCILQLFWPKHAGWLHIHFGLALHATFYFILLAFTTAIPLHACLSLSRGADLEWLVNNSSWKAQKTHIRNQAARHLRHEIGNNNNCNYLPAASEPAKVTANAIQR